MMWLTPPSWNIALKFNVGDIMDEKECIEKLRSHIPDIEERIDEEISQVLRETNKYLAVKCFDPAKILEGEFPEFKSDMERVQCACELAYYMRKDHGWKWRKHEENVKNFMKYIGPAHRVIFLKQLPLSVMEYMAKSAIFNTTVKEIMKIVNDSDSYTYRCNESEKTYQTVDPPTPGIIHLSPEQSKYMRRFNQEK